MKNFLLLSSIVLFIGFNVSAMDKNQECIIFIGNPGVGKSTLVNSIIGKQVFESGLNATGVTKFCQNHEADGRIYIDTPGFAYTTYRRRAAVEIEKALKKNTQYRIFFVLTLESGRIKPEDLHSINRVMDAIKTPDKQFNIIVNKLTGQEKIAIFESDTEYRNLCDQINSQSHMANSIYYIEQDRDLEDNETQFITIDERIKQFIHEKSKTFWLSSNKVETINPETVEELRRKARAEEERLRVELEHQRQRDDEMCRQIADQKRKLDELRAEEMRLLDYSLDVQCGGCGDF